MARIRRAGGLLLLWSVIPAAFVGPGTVTTCAAAGARFGFALLWALVFSVAACFVLQEAAARLTLASGLTLVETLGRRRGRKRSRLRRAAAHACTWAVVLGCAAYEAGNLMGAVAGLELLRGGAVPGAALGLGVLALALLMLATAQGVARALGAVVAAMAAAFVITAARVHPPLGELAAGALLPRLPQGSSVVLLGLLGTTVVPYNLFLGSALARKQRIPEMRRSLGMAVLAGGVISVAILVVGTLVHPPLSFDTLHETLAQRLGPWAGHLFGLGLFCAGLSSALTAPLAAALTVSGLLGRKEDSPWSPGRGGYHAVAGAVILCGVSFGTSGAAPIPVILFAQALNGLLLPLVAVFLLVAVNDAEWMGRRHRNTWRGNLALGLGAAVALALGANALIRALARVLG